MKTGLDFFRLFLRVIGQDTLLIICSIYLVLVLFLAFIGAHFTGYGYAEISAHSLQPLDAHHWCGTDINGRDLLTRTLYGAQVSLEVAAFGTLISLCVGVSYGLISGYVGGWLDNVLMRVVDILFSLPRLVLVIVIVAALEKNASDLLNYLGLSDWFNARQIILIAFLGLTEWMTMARIIRGQVLVLKEQQFVQAALALGQSHRQILWRHLLPNLTGIIVVYLTLTIPTIMLDESFMSFLGLGVQAPLASWGTLVADAASLLNPIRLFWWMLVFPGGMMALTLLALNFLGDGLRDALDPRVKK